MSCPPCAHPVKVGGLCALCGAIVSTADGQLNSDSSRPNSPNTSPDSSPNSSPTKPKPKRARKGPKNQSLTVSGGHTLRVSSSYASQHSLLERKRLRSKRKLSLVLDLDHTLVHCVSDERAREHLGNDELRTFLLPFDNIKFPSPEDIFNATNPFHCARHYLKLRPNLKTFLTSSHECYELTIYTAGTRYYALKVAHAICRYIVGADDVDYFNSENATEKEKEAIQLRKDMFGSRIVSRSDVGDLGANVKSLKRVFPDGGRMSVILDDREDVWANAKDNDRLFTGGRKGEPPSNLLYICPYRWSVFRAFDDVNNSSGADWGAQPPAQQQAEDDEYLTMTLDILKRLHEKFYAEGGGEPGEEHERAAPLLLQQMRASVFPPGCKFVFSGLVSLQEQEQCRKFSETARLPITRYAEDLGATVVSAVDLDVTHVVAKRSGTEKCQRGAAVPGCAVVSVQWLMQCYWSLKNASIMRYLLCPINPRTEESENYRRAREKEKEEKNNATTTTTTKTKDEENGGGNDDESSDDDFADGLLANF
ncbi:hypothetical protein TrST_g6744 [Triparma strigata]|uniref:protein-serine/threonine phosphatase n=1 Tax=Triparma strigata TaxID=1606541 RepID=A0A9W7BXD1_9STRA|nr:hypothetical protein TrST_g6744 [Triparma strigata]